MGYLFSMKNFPEKRILAFWSAILILPAQALKPQNSSESEARSHLVEMYNKLDSEAYHDYVRPKITHNQNGGFAWAVSYLLESYLIMHEVTKDTTYMRKFYRYARVVLDNTDAKRGIKDYKGRIRCGWSASSYSADKSANMVHFVHTGMILYPLLKYCLMCHENKKDNRFKCNQALCKEIMEIAEACVSEIEPQWRFDPISGQGFYMWEGDEPIKTDLTLQPPLNGQAAMGKSLALLYRLTSAPHYLSKVKSLSKFFAANASVTKRQTLRWGYRADTLKVQQMEDISHGAIDVEFAIEAWRLNLMETRFLKLLANTLISLKKEDGFAERIDGSSHYKKDSDKFIYSIQAGRWLDLSAVDCRVYSAVSEYYLKTLPTLSTLHPSGLLGIARLLKWSEKCNLSYNKK